MSVLLTIISSGFFGLITVVIIFFSFISFIDQFGIVHNRNQSNAINDHFYCQAIFECFDSVAYIRDVFESVHGSIDHKSIALDLLNLV